MKSKKGLVLFLILSALSSSLFAKSDELRNLNGVGRATALSKAEKSKIIDRVHDSNLAEKLEYVATLSKEQRVQLARDIRTINQSRNDLTKINETNIVDNEKPIVLVVQSLYITGDGLEYYKPFTYLRDNEFTFYFHRIENYWDGINKNKESIDRSLQRLLTKYPNRKIVVFSYCSGGIPALISLSELNEADSKRVHMVTSATPVSGYSAPEFFSYMGAPVAGAFTISIGIGSKKVQNMNLNNCEHHVTVNCEKDFHACVNKTGVFPQEQENMPCGNKNTYYYDDENHHSILATSIEKYFERNK